MEKLSFALLILISTVAVAKDWKFTPHIYSRGGVTSTADLRKEGNGKEKFNLGSWNDESNAFRNNLTEITIEAQYNNKMKYTYGMDTDDSNRYYKKDDSSEKKPLNERLNFIEFYGENKSFWFGNRASRGDGDYLLQNWPLDNHNMFGGGARFEKLGPLNIEFAYGLRRDVNPYNINLYINKIEMPLPNGKIKTNIEMHTVNNRDTNQKSKAYIVGGQFQRWGDKIYGGNLYNIFVVNYSKGRIYGGTMQSAFDSSNKNDLASKYLVKWGGDYKFNKYGIYYTFQYQNHRSKDKSEHWELIDFQLRPIFAITDNINTGIDYAMREELHATAKPWWAEADVERIALMLSYNMKNDTFGNPAVRAFIGQIHSEVPRQYVSNELAKRKEKFIRLDYEISI